MRQQSNEIVFVINSSSPSFFSFFYSILYQVLHVISLSLPLWIGRRNGKEKLYIYNCPDIVFMAFLCTWVDEFSPWYLPRDLQVLARVWRFLEPCKRRTASTQSQSNLEQWTLLPSSELLYNHLFLCGNLDFWLHVLQWKFDNLATFNV